MLHSDDLRFSTDRREAPRKGFTFSLAIAATMLTALFVNIAATGGAPLSAMHRPASGHIA